MVNAFLSFIEKSPSAFHAVEELCGILKQNGFTALNEQSAWEPSLSWELVLAMKC